MESRKSVQPTSPGPVILKVSVDDTNELGLFHLSPGSAQWQWLSGSTERLQMALTEFNALNLSRPDTAAPVIKLVPGHAAIGTELARATSLSLIDPVDSDRTIVLQTGITGVAAIAINGDPVITSSVASNTYLTKAAAATDYLAVHPGQLSAGTATQSLSADSFAFGRGTSVNVPGHVAVGRYNIIGYGSNGMVDFYQNDALFQVGNGSASQRSDAFIVYSSGDAVVSKTLYARRALLVGSGDPSGTGSFAGGSNAYPSGNCSFAYGKDTYVSSEYGASLGSYNNVTGWSALTLNTANKASGGESVAMGRETESSGIQSLSTGYRSAAVGARSFAAGSSGAEAHYSASFGLGTKAKSYSQFVLGRFNVLQTNNPSSWDLPAAGEDLFVIGNGTGETARSNAFTVKNNGDVRAAGVIRVKAAGDLSMGAFTSGPWVNP